MKDFFCAESHVLLDYLTVHPENIIKTLGPIAKSGKSIIKKWAKCNVHCTKKCCWLTEATCHMPSIR